MDLEISESCFSLKHNYVETCYKVKENNEDKIGN